MDMAGGGGEMDRLQVVRRDRHRRMHVDHTIGCIRWRRCQRRDDRHASHSKKELPMRWRHYSLALAAAAALAACGDDSAAPDEPPATPAMSRAPGSMAAEPGGTAAAEPADIVDTAVAAGAFGTLVSGVQAAELEETLRGDGPFTVFAPTDDAFAALPEGGLDELLADPTGDLADVLTYHVVAGEVTAAAVAGLDGQDVTTVNGATFTVDVSDGGEVSLTDAAGNEIDVVATDVDASNGVIHAIDGVLLPG
jgi:uncharacterized surface protein with fasciclin (FAS1) repeats